MLPKTESEKLPDDEASGFYEKCPYTQESIYLCSNASYLHNCTQESLYLCSKASSLHNC